MSKTLLWSVLLLVIVAEAYSFVAVRTALNFSTPASRRGFTICYWLLTLALWGLAIWGIGHRNDNDKSVAFTSRYLLSGLLLVLAAKLVVLLPMLLEDLTRLGRWAVLALGGAGRSGGAGSHAGEPIPRSVFVSRLALVLGALPLGAIVWGMVKGKTDYQVRRLTLRYPNLPVEFDGFKVLQISDLHTGSFDGNLEPLRRAVRLINAQQADLVVMTGDLVNNVATEVEPHIEELAAIRSKDGLPIFSILGNHDYGDYVQWPSREAKAANLQRLQQNHARIGWRLLMDETHTIRRGTAELAVLGVQNWSSHPSFPKHGNLPKAHAASGNAPFKLLLSHDPSHWLAQVVDYPDIDLMLAGHTHGMQFGVNLPHLKWSPVQYAYPQWAGLYTQGRQQLYVNVGLGYLGFPGRVGFLPEITLLELRRA